MASVYDDPFVQEIHQIRQRIFAECGNDLDRLIARLKAAESTDKDRLVTMGDIERRTHGAKAAI